MDFMYEWWFMGLMAVLLVALIGVYMYVKNKGAGED